MHVMGVILPVPEENEDRYLAMAESMAEIFMDYGALEVMECWESDISDGVQTDFRKAVAAQPGEKIVFSWAIWPDKAAADSAHEAMMQDERMQGPPEDMPFDGKRMIFGGFRSILAKGR
ncbi:MAG: DUF1428 domain-containing protein [Sphingomonadaceae bacterium]|nr:DUF1428 domain-containing protein [Sphingomonadaceae bacterium]